MVDLNPPHIGGPYSPLWVASLVSELTHKQFS